MATSLLVYFRKQSTHFRRSSTLLIGDDNTADLALDNPVLHHKHCMRVIKEDTR